MVKDSWLDVVKPTLEILISKLFYWSFIRRWYLSIVLDSEIIDESRLVAR